MRGCILRNTRIVLFTKGKVKTKILGIDTGGENSKFE